MQLSGILWGSNGLCGMRSIGSYGVSTGFQGEVTELCWVAMGLSGGSLGSYGALWQSFSWGLSRRSGGQKLPETANSLGALLNRSIAKPACRRIWIICSPFSKTFSAVSPHTAISSVYCRCSGAPPCSNTVWINPWQMVGLCFHPWGKQFQVY